MSDAPKKLVLFYSNEVAESFGTATITTPDGQSYRYTDLIETDAENVDTVTPSGQHAKFTRVGVIDSDPRNHYSGPRVEAHKAAARARPKIPLGPRF